ncbi:MAG: hypothetical protein LBH81_01115 [Rickettsiales bacterium]|jgi:dihydroorotase|nr:hypothetical protein [Rickettsiales bacterium]
MKVFNAHKHFREAGTPEFIEAAPIYTKDGGGVAMMNFAKPLDLSNTEAAVSFCLQYAANIMGVAAEYQPNYRLLLMPVLNNTMTPKQLENFIERAFLWGVPLGGFKLFTPGTSTNAGYAPKIQDAPELIDVLEYMKMPLALHLEDPDAGVPVAQKEESAMDAVLGKFIMKNGRQREMKISMEHLSTWRAVETAESYGLHYTITPHHLRFCLEDFGIKNPKDAEKVLSGENPYFWCKPVVQTRKNRNKLREHWVDGANGELLMLGTDGAPHAKTKKENLEPGKAPMAGIFMGGTALSYQSAFPSKNIRAQLEKYSKNAAGFYGVNWDDLPEARPETEILLAEAKMQNVMHAGKLATILGIGR